MMISEKRRHVPRMLRGCAAFFLFLGSLYGMACLTGPKEAVELVHPLFDHNRFFSFREEGLLRDAEEGMER